ncbi:MAG: biopolymer transporter ExbD, partial [Spirochaetia bacterium]
ADAAAQKNIVVTIDSAGNVYVDGGRVALAQLAPTLSATLGKRPNAPVIIMGDRDVRYDLVVRVLEIARTSGVNKLSLAVEVKK